MMTLTLIFLFALIIPMAITIVFSFLDFSSTPDKNRETSSPFECGFTSSSKARTPFSLRFFLLAVLFLIFDIEIVILLPTPIIMNMIPTSMFMLPFINFIVILTIGLMHEWNEGSLDWMS